MTLFHTEKEALKAFLISPLPVRTVIVWGDIGIGKSQAIKEVLSTTSAAWVRFSRNHFTAFEALRTACCLSADAPYEDIIYGMSVLYQKKGLHCF